MKSKQLTALVLCLMLLFLTAACSSDTGTQTTLQPSDTDAQTAEQPSDTDTPVSVTDLIGREITVTPGRYSRVICIGAGALRMYSYVCDTALLCGVEDIDNTTLTNRPAMFDAAARPYVLAYSDVFALLPSCGAGGPNAQTAEAEKILSCDPDIIISEYEDTDKANALQTQLGIPVVTLRSGADNVFDESFAASLRLLGKIFRTESRADELLSFIERQRTDIENRTANVPEDEKPTVYICGLGNWGTANHLTTSPDYVSFRVASVKNVAAGLEGRGVRAIEEEMFVDFGKDTDIMFMDAAAVKNIRPLLDRDSTLFDTNKAWKNGEVYLQMAFNAYYTNYEIALMNTWFIAKTVYPEAFADIDMTEKTNEITTEFLGKALSEEIFNSPAGFGGYQKIDTQTFFG